MFVLLFFLFFLLLLIWIILAVGLGNIVAVMGAAMALLILIGVVVAGLEQLNAAFDRVSLVKPPRFFSEPRKEKETGTVNVIAWCLFFLLVAAAVLSAWRPAFSQGIYSPLPLAQQTKPKMILPPEKFDHFYPGDLTIMMVNTVDDLRAACGLDAQAHPNLLACSIRKSSACLIIMVKDEVMRQHGWNTGLLLRHEIGHCNGWVGHDGERGVSSLSSFWAPEHERPRPKDGR
jgi:hypothetical protein